MLEPITSMFPASLFTTTLLPDTTLALCCMTACLPFELERLALYGEELAPPVFAEPDTHRVASAGVGAASEIPMLELLDWVFCCVESVEASSVTSRLACNDVVPPALIVEPITAMSPSSALPHSLPAPPGSR